MRPIRIYQAGIYQAGQLLELSAEASQHVAVVLRMQVGEPLILFGGDNKECSASIEELKKKKVLVRIHEVQEKDRESKLNIHLAQALSKGDRMDWVMQKAVELGVSSIRPLITERCVVKLDIKRMEKKLKQWQSIVISACEQCGRNKVPVVHPLVNFTSYVKTIKAPLKLILHPETQVSFRNYTLNCSDLALIIGPEGGLSEAEVAFSLQHEFQPLSLGPRILRTETAAITALSILQAVGGDL